MTQDILRSLTSALTTIGVGVMLRVYKEEKLKPYRKFGTWFILAGSLIVLYTLYKWISAPV